MSTQPIVGKVMSGKYDGRVRENKQRAKCAATKPKGRKPIWEKHLSRSSAARVFRALNVQQRMLKLLDTDDERLQFEVLRYVWDRVEGKPFVATNPNDSKSPQVYVDARVQTAIDKYVAMPEPKQLTQAAAKAGGGQEK